MTARPSTPAPRRTQAERRASAETRLLDAAIELVAEGGVRAVTTAAVGERAGFSRGIVNHHFGSRDAMMARVAEMVQSRFALRSPELRGMPRMLALVDDYLANVEAQPEDSRVFLRLWAAAIGDEEPALAAAFVQRDAGFRRTFELAIAEAESDGAIDPSIDGTAAAAIIVGMLRGLAMQWQVASTLVPLTVVRETARRLIEAGLSPAR